MKKEISNKAYDAMVKKASPNSKTLKDMACAFLVGGIICVIGQFINIGFSALNLSKENAASLTSASLIFIGAFLTGISVYDDIANFGKAGTLVPITGFANGIVSPAIEYKTEGYVLGVGAKMFIISGPVLAYGISASVIYGIIYKLISGGI